MTVNVLVSDTSVLIDLERGSLPETTFGLAFQFAVPDLLHHRELAEHGGPALIELGPRVEELDGDGVALAQHAETERALASRSREGVGFADSVLRKTWDCM